ncbi:rhodanese-related sulfurtransferase [Paenibacillus anaericanus]|uniref:rhodanese-like domain-containing protein n=1 Tax=Paenibacillus anaericanus TaxID=170367 RepID=UPI00277E2AC1|nr:rhodanese-like domain-containing protein [Paenibacillus anaericanus]MDQ0087390.1 rhodanese-related sulfurtransferase [Paenibacillus anaericanus]
MSTIIDGISHIDSNELHEIIQDPANRTLIIDVREPHEYIGAHIPGIPLIPMGEIASYIHDLDKEREYVFVCRSGYRSFQVANYFKHFGFEQVHNYEGGMLNWEHEVTSGPENIITTFEPQKLERE